MYLPQKWKKTLVNLTKQPTWGGIHVQGASISISLNTSFEAGRFWYPHILQTRELRLFLWYALDLTENLANTLMNPWWFSGKESSGNARNEGSISGWGDPLQKEMATHSSILTWKIPWTERSLGGYSPWAARARCNLAIIPPPPNKCEPCHDSG